MLLTSASEEHKMFFSTNKNTTLQNSMGAA